MVDHVDPRQPLDAHLAVGARHEQPQRVAVAVRQGLSIHLPGQEGAIGHGGLERRRVHIAVNRVEGDADGAGRRFGALKQGAQRDAVPGGVADQSSADSVADAFQRGLLSDAVRHASQVRKLISRGVSDIAAYLESPVWLEDLGVDQVLGHHVKVLRRRGRLDRTVVGHPVVAQSARAIEHSAEARGGQTDDRAGQAQQQPSPSFVGRGLRIDLLDRKAQNDDIDAVLQKQAGCG